MRKLYLGDITQDNTDPSYIGIIVFDEAIKFISVGICLKITDDNLFPFTEDEFIL